MTAAACLSPVWLGDGASGFHLWPVDNLSEVPEAFPGLHGGAGGQGCLLIGTRPARHFRGSGARQPRPEQSQAFRNSPWISQLARPAWPGQPSCDLVPGRVGRSEGTALWPSLQGAWAAQAHLVSSSFLGTAFLHKPVATLR